MREKTITILLIVLMCINSVSGYSMVMCHGQDGHVGLEPIDHNHCDCYGEHELHKTNQDESSKIPEGVSFDHHHCNDNLVLLDIYLLKQKDIKVSVQKVLNENTLFSDIASYNDYYRNSAISDIDNLSEFFTPLQTIILLT